MPTHDQIERAISLINHNGANYEYFFSKLASPSWIAPLYDKGFFRNPPPAEPGPNSISYPLWLESRYLVRMAGEPKTQKLLANICVGIAKTTNVRVIENILDIACRLPGTLARQFEKFIPHWLASQHPIGIPDKTWALVTHLIEQGEIGSGQRIAKLLVDASVPSLELEQGQSVNQQTAGLESLDWLDHARESGVFITPAHSLGQPFLSTLCSALDRTLTAELGPTRVPPEDYSYIWRPILDDVARGSEPRDSLSLAVFQLARTLAGEESVTLESVLSSLSKYRWDIVHRIQLRMIADAPELARGVLADYLADESTFSRYSVQQEYWEALSSAFHLLEINQQNTIFVWISEETASDPEREPQLDFWRLNRLQALADHLPAQLKDELNRLRARYGAVDRPFNFNVSRVEDASPVSPLSDEALDQMSLAEVVEYLVTWRPTAHHHFESDTALCHALKHAAASRPEKYLTQLSSFCVDGMPPRYIRCLLESLVARFNEGHSLDWHLTLDFATWVLSPHPNSPDFAGRHLSPLDATWHSVRHAVIELLECATSERDRAPDLDVREKVWALISTLLEDPDPTDERESESSGMLSEPVQLAANAVRCKAIVCALRYSSWIRSRIGITEGPVRLLTDLVPEVSAALERRLDLFHERSLAVRSVFGQYFPWLSIMDRDWSERHVSHVFPPDYSQQSYWIAAFEALLVYTSPGTLSFQLLRREFSRAVECAPLRQGGSARERRASTHLVHHLLVYYSWGLLTLAESDLISRVLVSGSSEDRTEAVRFLGRTFADSPSLPPEVRQKLLEFLVWWVARRLQSGSANRADYADLVEFGWWFASSALDAEYALATANDILNRAGRLEPDHLVARRLSELVHGYPSQSIHCLRKLAIADEEGWSIHGWVDEARMVVAGALSSGNSSAIAEAQGTIDVLLARHRLDLRALLDQ